MIFHIALKDLIITLKDRRALLTMLLMPILIIFILGTAFSGTFNQEVAVSKFTIGVVNKDDGMMSQFFINNFLRKEMSKMFTTYVVTEKEAQEMLEGKKAPSIITIPAGFSKDIESNKPVSLEVKSVADSRIKSKMVESVTQSFAQGLSMSYASAFAVIDQSKKYGFKLPEGQNGISQVTMVMGDLQKKLTSEGLEFNEKEQTRSKNLSAIQYYSAGMLLMFILFGANQGIMLFINERQTKTLGRMMTSKAGRVPVIVGKYLGLFIICLVQAAILIAFTALVYRVNWGSSLLGIALVTLCSVFAGAALGMFIAAVAKTFGAANGLSQVFIQVSTLLGGGMIPVYIMPTAMQYVSKVTINWWGLQGYLKLMSGSGAASVLQYCGILVLMGLVYLTLGILKFRVE